ncbi:hypothetical protein CVH13_00075, partial [Dehalococcoides mccartyi]
MWFIIGVILGVLIFGLVQLLRHHHFNLSWYEWLMVILGTALLLFGIQNFTASFAEMESTAGYMLLLFIGLPAVILLAIAWRLAVRR